MSPTVTAPVNPEISSLAPQNPSAKKRNGSERYLISRLADVGSPILLVVVSLLILRFPDGIRDAAFVILGLIGVALSVSLRRFAAVWTLVLATIPIIQLQGSLFGMAKLSVFRFALLGLTLVFLLYRKPPGFWTQVAGRLGLVGFGLFLLANVVSGIYLGYIDSIYRTASYSEPLFVFVLTYYLVKKDPANAQRFMRAIVISGLAVSILGVVEYIRQESILDFLSISYSGPEDPLTYLLDDRYGLGGRIASTFLQPVYAGTAFFMYAIVSAFYVRMYKPISYRLLVVLLPAFGVLLVLLTGSRGPLVSIVPAGIAFTLLVGGKRAGLTVICIAALAFSLSLSGVLPRITEYFSDSVALGTAASNNVFDRLDLTTTLLEMFKQNPVLGFGPGMIQKLAGDGLIEFKRIAGLENQYAAILAEGGVLSGCTYLLFILGVLMLPFRIFKTSRSEEVKHWALITLALLIYLFAGAAFANFLVSPILNTIIAIFAITVARHETFEFRPHGSHISISAS